MVRDVAALLSETPLPHRNVEALLRYLDERLTMPHAWGRHANDCVSFGACAVKAQTGRNPIGRIRWTTRNGALRVLKRLGGIEAVLDARFQRIAPAQAMRGDIGGVADRLLGIHPMIVEGATLVAPGSRGLKRLPRSEMIVAWSVVDRREASVSPSPPSPGRGARAK